MASVTAGAAGSVRRLEGTTIVFGTNLRFKGFHNQGGMIQARASKFLTIPATTDALYAGGMRNFPRPLRIVWDEARGKGIAYEKVAVTPKRRTPRQGRGGTRGSRKRMSKIKKFLNRVQKQARKLWDAFKGIKKKVRPKRSGTKKKKKPKTKMIIHYYLRKWVIIPQRKFLEVSQDTQTKVGKILVQEAIRYMKGTQ